MTVLFGIAIFGSAFLLFLVQPMVAKQILPWFGGTPAVWTLCLAFYQSALFAGYLYAHGLIRWVPPTGQLILHGTLLAASLLTLPILPGMDWAAATGQPTGRILSLLTIEIALPFVALAATGPLVQAWFARRHPHRSPYPLYALSNAGSVAALLAYPFVIEPGWPLSAAGWAWGVAFFGVAAAILANAWQARGGSTHELRVASAPADSVTADEIPIWLALSGAAVVVLMGVTNRLCLDVASIPFLWVLPLALYLATFIACFSGDAWYSRRVFLALSLLALTLSLARQTQGISETLPFWIRSVQTEILLYGSLLFSTCMVLHGELYRRRPASERLTLFYLCVSGGGALGGLFVGLIAPRIFTDYAELSIGLALAVLAVAATTWREWRSPTTGGLRLAPRIAATILVACALAAGHLWLAFRPTDGLVWSARSFFGVLRIFEEQQAEHTTRSLRHGSTLHGVQIVEERFRRLPTTYYGRGTGLAAAFAARDPASPARVGVVGLGVGTVAAYGQPGDLFRFYEIDPAVADVARSSGLFHYLTDSSAEIEIVLGDARLTLEQEQRGHGGQGFDILVLDAFSSDAIPTHLMTVEAFEVYRAALAEGGVIAVHTSNRHLELMPVVSRIGAAVGLKSLWLKNQAIPKLQSQRAEWVLLGTELAALEGIAGVLHRIHASSGVGQDLLGSTVPYASVLARTPLWTDDYTNLFGVLRTR